MRRYESYKDTKIEWLGQIPKHWEIKKLFWISDITSGTTPEANYDKYYNNGEYHWVNTGDLNDGSLIGTSKFVTRVALLDYSALKIVKPNTVVIAMYGATIGKLSILKINAVANQACCCISTNESKLNYSYLFYYLLSNREHIINMSYGAGQPNISQDIIKNFNLSYPPIIEQQQIADYLDKQTAKIDELVQKQNKLIETLLEKKKSLINHVVTKGLNPDVPMKDSGIEWLGHIPQHWGVRKIKRLSQVKRGASPRPIDDQRYFSKDGEYGWVRISDVTASEKYLYQTEQMLSDLGVTYSVKQQVGDIFLSIAGSVGKPIITQIKCCIHDGFVWFDVLKYDKDFLYYIFLNGECFNGLGKFGTQLNLNTNTIGDIFVPFLSEEETKEIIRYLNKKTAKIDELINKSKSMVELLKEHKQSLINHVVTGKIKVFKDFV